MPQFIITYDLHNRRVYQSLYQLMTQWKAVRLTDSLWLANLKGPAPVVRDIVLSKLDEDDAVAIVELKPGSDWATMRVKPAANDWLGTYVSAPG